MLLLLLLLCPKVLLGVKFFLILRFNGRWLVAWKGCQESAVWGKSVHTLLRLSLLRLSIRGRHVI
jgi:hypothetical protein